MLDTKSENISGEAAVQPNEMLELTADELNAVTGGMEPQIHTEMQFGNDTFHIYATAKGYTVEHVHKGR